MSRSGYIDDYDDPLVIGRWRGMVSSAIRGKRGQKFLQDLVAALDEMQNKRLVANQLITFDGNVCALGALGIARSVDLSRLDPEDSEAMAKTFGIAECLAQETVYMNDEQYSHLTPEQRWMAVRSWAASLSTSTVKTEVT
jgi:hypothetical protein